MDEQDHPFILYLIRHSYGKDKHQDRGVPVLYLAGAAMRRPQAIRENVLMVV